MIPFQRTMRAHLQGVEIKIGSVTVTVQETFLDRVIRVFSPKRADKRLAARALALPGSDPPPAGPRRYVVSRGIPVRRWEDREGSGAYSPEECGDYRNIVRDRR